MSQSKRVAAYISVALAILAAIVALAAGNPGAAVVAVEKAVPVVESIVADTDKPDTIPAEVTP